VPFCRAANGTLAAPTGPVSKCAMAILRVVSVWIARFRAQRWSKEIVLAIVLTLAAVGFIVAAMGSTDEHAGRAAPYAAGDKQERLRVCEKSWKNALVPLPCDDPTATAPSSHRRSSSWHP
jgi:hypothetical protein